MKINKRLVPNKSMLDGKKSLDLINVQHVSPIDVLDFFSGGGSKRPPRISKKFFRGGVQGVQGVNRGSIGFWGVGGLFRGSRGSVHRT